MPLSIFFVHTGVQALSQASFGLGTGSILLSNVACTGSERVLMNCTASSTVTGCTHAQDAGVRCPSGRVKIYYRVLMVYHHQCTLKDVLLGMSGCWRAVLD